MSLILLTPHSTQLPGGSVDSALILPTCIGWDNTLALRVLDLRRAVPHIWDLAPVAFCCGQDAISHAHLRTRTCREPIALTVCYAWQPTRCNIATLPVPGTQHTGWRLV